MQNATCKTFFKVTCKRKEIKEETSRKNAKPFKQFFNSKKEKI